MRNIMAKSTKKNENVSVNKIKIKIVRAKSGK